MSSLILCWFGHKSNLPDLNRVLPSLDGRKIHILTNMPGYVKWSPENHKAMMRMPSIVILPTGKSMAKSENRMVEAIRGGHYVCAEYLPAYEPFYKFFPELPIHYHVDLAIEFAQESVARIYEAQNYIRDIYSPAAIGREWLEVINGN